MALTAQLPRVGITPRRIHTGATVKLEKVGEGFSITKIELESEADIPGIDGATFQRHALDAKQNCPVSDQLFRVGSRLARCLRPACLSILPLLSVSACSLLAT